MISLLVRRDALTSIPDRDVLSPSHQALVQQAQAVLHGNWLGNSTKPAPSLYPYQWSWDSAFIAMGYAHVDASRAMQELRSLFDGQWRNGLVPHIVFHHPDPTAYFPGPDYWQTERSPHAPTHVATSGIIQPPVHAIAAWQIYRYASDREQALDFLVALFPKLLAWHHYLYRERNPNQDGLIYIRHPWESGQDNSPMWDTILQRMELTPEMIPPYQRVDNRKINGSQRPSDHDYDRYVYLLAHARDRHYTEARIQKDCPFLIQDVLFNALLVRANQDLAAIADVLDFDSTPFRLWAQQTAVGLNAKLWNPQQGCYQNYDLVADQPITNCVASNFAPLYAGVPNRKQAQRMVERLLSSEFASPSLEGWMVPSTSRQDDSFNPNRYWRGPIWINLNWTLYQGLRTYGYESEAFQLKQMSLDLVERFGFYEYFNPDTGEGLGSANFSWTASLILDLILGE